MAQERLYLIEWGGAKGTDKVHHFMAEDIDEAQAYRAEFCKAHMILDSDLYVLAYDNQLIYRTVRQPWEEMVYG